MTSWFPYLISWVTSLRRSSIALLMPLVLSSSS